MSQFTPRSARFHGTVTIAGAVGEAFELFSPLGESLWVPDWKPELLHPPNAVWEEDLIFRTQEETGEAIWVVTSLDRAAQKVKYHRVEPGRYVARIAVSCAQLADDVTEVSTVYEFIGLSESGNTEIAAMTQESYGQKMARWTRWINDYLARGTRKAAPNGGAAGGGQKQAAPERPSR